MEKSMELTDKLKKSYMLFAGSIYYPSGGWEDFKGYFSSVDKAKLWLQKNEPDACDKWAQIVYNDKIVIWASSKDTNILEDGMWEWRTDNNLHAREGIVKFVSISR